MSPFAMDGALASNRPLSIVVLLGGWSAEREISLASGRAVAQALRSRGHEARELDPAEIDFFTYPWVGVDGVFIALHGSFGEDGTVQALLDEMRIPYTGSGPDASRCAISKSASKQRFRAQQLPTPDYQTVHVQEPFSSSIEKATAIGYPLVVKPDAQGSSIGVSIVRAPEELAPALEQAFRYHPLAILEQFVAGRELTVAVLERCPLPVIEIRPARPFFDYEAKYRDDTTRYVFESDLPRAVVEQVEAVAVSAVETLGCSGVTRVDMRLDGQQRPWLLEVNTSPGLTDHSLVPKAALRMGLSFAQLCEWLVCAKISRSAETAVSQAA